MHFRSKHSKISEKLWERRVNDDGLPHGCILPEPNNGHQGFLAGDDQNEESSRREGADQADPAQGRFPIEHRDEQLPVPALGNSKSVGEDKEIVLEGEPQNSGLIEVDGHTGEKLQRTV